jgi:hypothetical protein
MTRPACHRCGEPVLRFEQDEHHLQPMHIECGARGILGGLNHMLGHCTCCGGTSDPDPPGLTKRQAAIAAFQYWRLLNVEQREETIVRRVPK